MDDLFHHFETSAAHISRCTTIIASNTEPTPPPCSPWVTTFNLRSVIPRVDPRLSRKEIMKREGASVVSSQPSLSEARKVADDWTAVDARQERKKIQNRLNQRARRRRTAPSKKSSEESSFQVDRWRVNELVTPTAKIGFLPPGLSLTADEVDPPVSESQSPVLDLLPSYDNAEDDEDPSLELINSSSLGSVSPNSCDWRTSPPVSVTFPLSSDHLLHLIHFNVFRAITSNKAILSLTTTLTKPDRNFPIIPSTTKICDGLTLIKPVDPSLPPALYPTQLQMSYPHSSWMNMFPCSSLRDNLIARDGTYDAADLMNDLIGDIFPTSLVSSDLHDLHSNISDDSSSGRDQLDYDMDVSARRRGLIVWGDPWVSESWEVTPGFLRKWGLLLEGCDDLITASNRWRSTRGEEPLERVG